MTVHRIFIQLDIEGDEGDVYDVLNGILDEGVLQDTINASDEKPLKVKSATVCWAPEVP